MRERHKGLVTYGKSWQQSRAKAAEKSILAITAFVQSARRASMATSALLMTAFIVIILVYLSRQEVFQVSESCLEHPSYPPSPLFPFHSFPHLLGSIMLVDCNSQIFQAAICRCSSTSPLPPAPSPNTPHPSAHLTPPTLAHS